MHALLGAWAEPAQIFVWPSVAHADVIGCRPRLCRLPRPPAKHRGAQSCTLLQVYGSFSDVWTFDPSTARWQPLAPTTAVQPAPRDHHGGALWADRLFIFGGRFGAVGL